MFRSVAMCCVLWCVGVSMAFQCTSPRSATFKLSIISQRNKNGSWTAQVTLGHGTSEEDPNIWTVDVDHTTTKCEKTESVVLVANVAAPPQKPGPHYELVPGLGYYKFHKDRADWEVARETCAQEGSHLLILNSDSEFAAVNKIWNLHRNITGDWWNNFVHVGLTDHVVEGQFVTLFGEHVNNTGYVKWARNEPNSGNTANCAGVGREGLISDSSCFNILAFFCEQS